MNKNFSLAAFAATVDKSFRVSAERAEDRAEATELHADNYVVETSPEDYSERLALELDKRTERSVDSAGKRRVISDAHRAAYDANVFARPTDATIRASLHKDRIAAWNLTGKDRKAAIGELRVKARQALKSAMKDAAEVAAAK